MLSATGQVHAFDVDLRKLTRAGKASLLSPELSGLPINTIMFLSDTSLLMTDVTFNHVKASPSLKFLYAQVGGTKQVEQESIDFDRMDAKLIGARDKLTKVDEVVTRKKFELEQTYLASVKAKKAVENQTKKAEIAKVVYNVVICRMINEFNCD